MIKLCSVASVPITSLRQTFILAHLIVNLGALYPPGRSHNGAEFPALSVPIKQVFIVSVAPPGWRAVL